MEKKTVYGTSDTNGAKKCISDLKVFGAGDMFKLISKASSEEHEFMKSTKAMEIPGVGCVVQVSTNVKGQVAEAVCFVPGVKINDKVIDEHGIVTERELVAL